MVEMQEIKLTAMVEVGLNRRAVKGSLLIDGEADPEPYAAILLQRMHEKIMDLTSDIHKRIMDDSPRFRKVPATTAEDQVG